MQATRPQESASLLPQHNQALVSLARAMWLDDCTLDDALATICEVAARTLEVDRVNVWQLLPDERLLRCVHAYEREAGSHNSNGFDESFDSDTDYVRELDVVRVIDADDVARDATLSASRPALGAYLAHHDIRSLLDAPVRSEGVLIGVVCHEQVGRARHWTPDDQAFAASIGDYVALAQEIARRRAAEARLRYLAQHDAQTGLPTRDHFLEAVHAALHPRHGDVADVCAIHLQVQSASANASDDALLGAIATRIRDRFGRLIALARVGSSALAMLPHADGLGDEAQALNLAEECLELVQQGAVDADVAHASAAIGIAFARDLVDASADQLLDNAELASQRAQQGGVNRCELHDAGRHRALVARIALEQALRDAIAAGRMEVHYQPSIDLRDGRWCGAEALLRWRDDEGRVRTAAEFIAVAEASGLIVGLGRWVLLQACQAARGWPRGGDAAPILRVNVSARQFEHAALQADVAHALALSGLPAERLCLELTETALLVDPQAALQALQRLRTLGVSIAIDDFGVGYSSLSRLKRLPVDVLKLDQGFVAGLPHDRFDLAVVRAVVGMAQEKGILVVAEGVETEAQAQALRDCGITQAQGWLYAAALTGSELLERFGSR